MAAAASQRHKRRPAHELNRLNDSPYASRASIVNHYNQARSALAPTTARPGLAAFLPKNLWPWISNYLKHAFERRHPFLSYPEGETGIYRLEPLPGNTAVKLAIAGDWGTGTDEAATIMDRMTASNPDLTIHLGDIYYVGDFAEVEENCFGKETNGYAGVTWKHGSQGSFALNGNHEMYANGKAYFTRFLASLGQLASFFCIEAGGWRVLGIDTGYNSVGVPILSMIPGINRIPFIGGDCHLDQKLLSWLRDVVRPQADPKPTVILSHHEYFSAFGDRDYAKPARQLMEFFPNQEVVWIWGHEHRLATYEPFGKSGGIRVWGRCLGHGGMPVDLGTPDRSKAPAEFYDERSHKLDDGSDVGENGYVVAELADGVLTLDYRDIHDEPLLVERFTAGPNGTLRRTFTNTKLQPAVT